jgi:hypothetical protein
MTNTILISIILLAVASAALGITAVCLLAGAGAALGAASFFCALFAWLLARGASAITGATNG